MNGVAHVTFAGGGIMLPAREPDDRRLDEGMETERMNTHKTSGEYDA